MGKDKSEKKEKKRKVEEIADAPAEVVEVEHAPLVRFLTIKMCASVSPRSSLRRKPKKKRKKLLSPWRTFLPLRDLLRRKS